MTYDTINNDVTMAGGAEGALLANRYRIVRQLGQGGMGSVWLAEDTQLDNKQFAIKMLPSILVSNKRAYRQLKDETLVAMKLSHPNIVTLRAFDENNGNPFLVMDYIAGRTLDDYLAEAGNGDLVTGSGLPETEVVQILEPIAAALDYAHGEGVVHRDIKPANVMIRADGHPFILDFGISREIQDTMSRVTGELSSGTLPYMSPEQLKGEPPAPAQDIYSFAAMTYECLKGAPPFCRGHIKFQIANNRPEPLGQGCSLSELVMAGLEKDPSVRPATCMAVLGLGGSTETIEDAEAVPKPDSHDAIDSEERLVPDKPCQEVARPTDKKRILSLSIKIAAVIAVLSSLFLVGRIALTRRNEAFWNEAMAAYKAGRFEDAAKSLEPIRSYPLFFISRDDFISEGFEEQVRNAIDGQKQLQDECARMRVEVNEIVDWLLRTGCAELQCTITNDFSSGVAAHSIGDYTTAIARFSAVTNNVLAMAEAASDECEELMRRAWDDGSERLAPEEWKCAKVAMAAGDDSLEDGAYTNAIFRFRQAKHAYQKASEVARKAKLAALCGNANKLESEAKVCLSNLFAMGAATYAGDAFDRIKGRYASGTNAFSRAHYDDAIKSFAAVTNDFPKCAAAIAQTKSNMCSVAKNAAEKALTELRQVDATFYAETKFAEILDAYTHGMDACLCARYDEATEYFELVSTNAPPCLSEIEIEKKKHKDALYNWEVASTSYTRVKDAIGDNLNCARWLEAKKLFKKGDIEFKGKKWDAASAQFKKARTTLDEMFTRGTAFPKKPKHLQPFTLELPEGAEIEMIYVGPGKFDMGCDGGYVSLPSLYGSIDYKPAHQIALKTGFWLGKHEVTQKQWGIIMKNNYKNPNRPVANVSWNDCQKFISKVNALPLLNCTARLPTEAEWEYACRAGTLGAYANHKIDEYFTPDRNTGAVLERMGWYSSNSDHVAHVVGKKESNPWGFCDMHGNVWEWCNDWYKSDYYVACWPPENPQGPRSGGSRVLRGGSYSSSGQFCRSFIRHHQIPSYRSEDCGFRLCCSALP